MEGIFDRESPVGVELSEGALLDNMTGKIN